MCAKLNKNTDVRRVGLVNQSLYITIPVIMAREMGIENKDYVYVTKIGSSLNIRKITPAENAGVEGKNGD